MGNGDGWPSRVVEAIRALIVAAALAHGVDPILMDRMAYCESTYNPFAVSGPNVGLYQLSRYGKQKDFFDRGYTDLFDPAQQANFTAEELSEGQGPAWACWWIVQRPYNQAGRR
jgi:soluble lytic murein transglycosylase-like protein